LPQDCPNHPGDGADDVRQEARAMTTFDPTQSSTTVPPRAAGPWAWLLDLVRSWFAAPAMPTTALTSAGMAARLTGLGGEDAEGAYVVAPGGYRIRVPRPDAVSGKVGQMLPSVKKGMELVPPLPHVVADLLREVQDANATAASVAAIAANDPSLAAGLLRTVNSSAFGLTRKVTAVADAVSYIGFTSVKSMVLRLQLDSTLGKAATAGNPEAAIDVEDVWVHSLIVSYVADALAERVSDADRGLAATLGLLHDLGKLVVLSRFPDEAAKLREAPTVADEPQLDREARVLGVDHAALGANLAGRWGLPGDLVRAIRWHHQPERAFERTDPKPLRQAAALVQVANQLAKYLYVYQDHTELDVIAPATFDLLGLGRDLPALLTPAVRAAAGRAILFADDGSQRPSTAVRRFLRLARGEQAAALLAAAGSSPRQQVEVDDVDSAELFLTAAQRDLLRSTATPTGIKRLAADVARVQAALPLSDAARPVLSMLARAILANAAGGTTLDTVEVTHAVEDGRARLAVRSPELSFARRFGEGADPDACLAAVDAELANVLNLGWCESITVSSDGATYVFTVAG
jgi:putative nucleotidyltransferase with HDIG domain